MQAANQLVAMWNTLDGNWSKQTNKQTNITPNAAHSFFEI